MEQAWIAAIGLVALFGLLGAGLWIALSLLGVGWLVMVLFSTAPAGKLMATTVWGSSNGWALTSLPLFIWMGEILFRSRISQDMFHGLAPWVSRLPGRLLHCNVVGCGIFAAISGSSAATAATIGKITVPELKKRGYDEGMVVGSLAGSGTLGLLIPPSIIMIVYGVAAEVSIARLFIAGVVPGILLVCLFSGYIAIWALLNPERTPPSDLNLTFLEKVRRTGSLVPAVLLIGSVIGSIYAGLTTPTEAAALGVAGSLLLAGFTGGLTWANVRDSIMGAMRTSCMIAFILTGAAFLTVAMGFTKVPSALAAAITALQLSPIWLIVALTILYIILGCFLDGISMVVLTSAVILPTVEAAHIDLVWFGIFIVLVVEMAQITPPVGFNLYVLQGLTGHNIFYVARATLPFFFLMCLAVAIITAVPGIATWLPTQMFTR